MKTYSIIMTSGAETKVSAHDYTEDSEAGRVYFHQDEDKSDRKSFFLLSEVAGIMDLDAGCHLNLHEARRRNGQKE